MKPQGYYDLMEAFSKPGCPVCHILQITTERFIMYLLADRVMDVATLDALRARRGLCNQHISELIQQRGIVLPLAIFYEVVIDEIVQVIDHLPTTQGTQGGWRSRFSITATLGNTLADALEPRGPCLICADAHDQEERLTGILCEYLATSPMKERYLQSQGFCIQHLQQALRATQDAQTMDLLIFKQTALWTECRVELEEFIAKLNHARRDEKKGVEGGSLMRAIRWMAGSEGIFGQDPRHR